MKQLLSDKMTENNLKTKENIKMIHPSKIRPAKIRLRKLDLTALEDLAKSVDEVGFLQNIIVRPIEKDEEYEFECVFGNHRLAVANSRDKLIPCAVRKLDNNHSCLMAISENIQRNNFVDPVVEGEIFSELCSKNWKITDITKAIGKSSGYVISRKNIFEKLHPKLLKKLSDKAIPVEMAEAISSYPLNEQLDFHERIKQQRDSLKTHDAKKCYHCCPIHCPKIG